MYVSKEELFDLNSTDYDILMNHIFLRNVRLFFKQDHNYEYVDATLITRTNYPWKENAVLVEFIYGPDIDHLTREKRTIYIHPDRKDIWHFSYEVAPAQPHEHIPIEEAWIRDNTPMLERMMSIKKAGLDDIFIIDIKNLKGCSDEVYEKISRLIQQRYNVNTVYEGGRIICFLLDDEDIFNEL